MTLLTKGDRLPDEFFTGSVARIRELQRDNGAIPWFDGGVIDPWNHTEAAMGLAVLGEMDAAERAYGYLKDTQLDDGSWWGELGSAVPMDEEEQRYTGGEEGAGKPVRDTNFAAYIATGAWHHYLLTGDKAHLKDLWPHVKKAMDFVLAHQSEHGEIRWAADDPHTPEDDALITGCSSIYKSLECAVHIARELNEPSRDWAIARHRLGKRCATNRTGSTAHGNPRAASPWTGTIPSSPAC